MTDSLVNNRQQLRIDMRQHRNRLNNAEQDLAARNLAKIVCASPAFIRSSKIALYLASDGEIDPKYILDKAFLMKKQCFLPVLNRYPKTKMSFYEYRYGDPLKKNRFGILEPDTDKKIPISCKALQLVLLPLVAFDQQGNRLGMGGGFYDRAFAFKNPKTHNVNKRSAPILMGLAHDCQKVESLEDSDWDIPLSSIATDKKLIEA